MGAFRVEITPQPAVAGAQSVVGATSSKRAGKPQVLAGSLAAAVATALPSGTVSLGRQLPDILVALLTPAALVAFVMGVWRVSVDLDWASAFPIASGFFSHWQVWIALSIALKILSSSLLAWDGRTRKISEEN
jgi:hypothetical protein